MYHYILNNTFQFSIFYLAHVQKLKITFYGTYQDPMFKNTILPMPKGISSGTLKH